ncbi:uncharacterized protein TNCV_3587041 [Trichonephila clavipes]|nr:uncharacterized protein TNCV_3587041 [Trichonephila clavipes]
MQYKTRKPKCTGEVCLKHQPCVKERRSSCTIVHIELVTSWPVTVLWILLSWLVSTLATTAYVHPEWFVREHYSKHEILNYDRDALVSTMGMVSVCYRGHDKKDTDELECHNFDEDFPSSSWQTSYVLFGSGCVLLTWCSILAFCNIWIIGKKNRQLVAMLIGRIQLVAVGFSSKKGFILSRHIELMMHVKPAMVQSPHIGVVLKLGDWSIGSNIVIT